ncbi:nucleotide pyrophosphohydrolase [Rubrivivax albus]|uniref:Nucleotide pyrophosphohydrolase n=1 Tax=Rubrivivax albus TaxID=2499835 RepID=A0A437JVH0_9BURK|nr:nucleotide pyrophosphohydrolase [Rubrivivax albus]RVT51279.1 nucleotide pyrophosphohydrolase [Rubrivivax albus]
MDIEALQATLRTFAAERDWQPFHTPKNLSTALMVEAAELAEIFQWMTPEQSASAHTDAVVREQISDEVADVLLYLIQIADHTQVDLKRAIGRKLVKNAKKHPPLRTGLPAGTAATSTVETHVLVDWENVQPREGDLRALVPDVTDVWIFHSPNQKVDPESYGSFGSRATPVKIARTGKNALDFHLSFYMGYIASRHPDARFVVVSNDKGYGPMLEHAEELGFSARQAGFGASKPKANGGPMFSQAPTPTPAVIPAAVAAPPAAKKAAAKTTASAKTATPATPKPAAKKAAAKSPAKKAAAKKTPAKTAAKTAAKKTTGQPAATPKPQAAAKKAAALAKKTRGLDHVIASLKKTQSKPARQAALLAMIKSLLVAKDDDPIIQKTLNDMVAAGKIAISDTGAVQYSL